MTMLTRATSSHVSTILPLLNSPSFTNRLRDKRVFLILHKHLYFDRNSSSFSTTIKVPIPIGHFKPISKGTLHTNIGTNKAQIAWDKMVPPRLITSIRGYATELSSNILTLESNINLPKKELTVNLREELEILGRNLDTIVPSNGLEEKLKRSYESKTPLRIKLGFDPTAPDLHLGHAVALKKLRQFQELGHKIVIIIGDFTALIGDPTGRNKTRPPLTPEEVKTNAKTYLDQLSKIIDVAKAEVRFNSEWFNKLSMRDTIELISKITLAQILQREDFSNRSKQNIPIFFHELLYPIIQGYDSFMINADVEMGGTDQLFNCLVGRDIQSVYQKPQQVVACVPILRGTDGQQKMSKSLKNYIGLTDDPFNMYGKVMSIPDDLIEEYVHLASSFTQEKTLEILKELRAGSSNPMRLKKELAHNIVQQYHGGEMADKSEQHFYNQVQSRDESKIDFQNISLQQLSLSLGGLTLISVCSALMPEKSKSELRRVITNGGVNLNSEKITDPNLVIENLTKEPFKIKIGKRNFYKIDVL